MSQEDNNNSSANGSNASANALNQVAFQTAEGNHSRNQMFVLVDFDVRHVFRAFFHVPWKRSQGVATLGTGQTVNEKQLHTLGDFLTLKERVQFRQRVFVCDRVLFFSKWDMDGPDLRFFGEWTSAPPKSTVHIQAGPWSMDGRQLVADAKDTGVLLAEAAARAHGDGQLELGIFSPFDTNVVTQRGWKLGRALFDAFWSGMRKAADALQEKLPNVKLVAVCEIDPFAEFKSAKAIGWKKFQDVSSSTLLCVPGDAFATLGTSELEMQVLQHVKIQFPAQKFMIGLMTNCVPVQQSTFVPMLRTPLWNPESRLALLDAKPENKCKFQKQHRGQTG